MHQNLAKILQQFNYCKNIFIILIPQLDRARHHPPHRDVQHQAAVGRLGLGGDRILSDRLRVVVHGSRLSSLLL